MNTIHLRHPWTNAFFSARFTDHWFQSAVEKFWSRDDIFVALWFWKYWSRVLFLRSFHGRPWKVFASPVKERYLLYNLRYFQRQLLFNFSWFFFFFLEVRSCILSFRPCCLLFTIVGRTKEWHMWSVFSKPQSYKNVITWSEFFNRRLKPTVREEGWKKSLVHRRLR